MRPRHTLMYGRLARLISVSAFIGIFGLSATAQAAASNYVLDGSATMVAGNGSPNGVQLDSTQAGETGGVGLLNLPANLKVNDLTGLSVDYRSLSGDCGPGSPRFMLGIDVNGNGVVDNDEWALVELHQNQPGCSSASWQSSGNLLGANAYIELQGMDASLTAPSTMADLKTNFGNYSVLKLDIEVDGYISTNLQRFQFDNATFTTAAGTTTYTFDPETSIKVPSSINTGAAPTGSRPGAMLAVIFGSVAVIALGGLTLRRSLKRAS